MMDESRFIGELINVEYDQPPLPEKKTRCPNRFSLRSVRPVDISLLCRLVAWALSRVAPYIGEPGAYPVEAS